MSKASNLAKNTVILATGKLSSQVIAFLLLPLYTHYLNPSEYGLLIWRRRILRCSCQR